MKNFITILLFFTALLGHAQDLTSDNIGKAVEALRKGNTKEAFDFLNSEISTYPKNGYAYYWISCINIDEEELGKALTNANLALKNIPSKDKKWVSYTYEKRAEIYCQLEDTTKAIADLSSAIKISPKETDAYQSRADIYHAKQRYDLSDADYKKIISIDPGKSIGYVGLARNLNAQGLWDEAIKQLDYAEKLEPTNSYIYAHRSDSYLGKKDWDKATDDIVTAIYINNNEKAFYSMFTLKEEALTRLKAKLQIQAAKEPNEGKWPYLSGSIYEYEKNYKQAIKFYTEANKRDLSATTLNRISICYRENGQCANALTILERALNIDPNSSTLLQEKATLLYELGLTQEAISQWDAILAQYPDYANGYHQRGWCKLNARQTDEAIEDFTLAITLAPESAHSYLNRAEMYRKQGKDALAKADYEKVIELEKNPENYSCCHYAYQRLGNPDKAVEVMDSIIARDTTNAGNYYDAACLYTRMNKTDKALKYLEKSFQKGYKNFVHIANDYDMDPLRDMSEFEALIKKYQDKAQKEAIPFETIEKNAQNESVVEIPFTKESGSSLCNVKCTINSLPLHFIFDTGASNVSLSQVEATFMMKNGYLSDKDVMGNAYFYDASGNVNVGTIINLKEVGFGGLSLTNVKASVVQNQKAPLLLGQSVLGRLGKIEIDNSKHVLRITSNY